MFLRGHMLYYSWMCTHGNGVKLIELLKVVYKMTDLLLGVPYKHDEQHHYKYISSVFLIKYWKQLCCCMFVFVFASFVCVTLFIYTMNAEKFNLLLTCNTYLVICRYLLHRSNWNRLLHGLWFTETCMGRRSTLECYKQLRTF